MAGDIVRWMRSHIPASVRPALRSARRALRRLYYVPLDAFHVARRGHNLMPPPSLMFVGDGDFRRTGEEFKGHFITLGGLKPEDRVLDVGCGVGRMALPLLTYLTRDGEYHGFDIVASGIDWCRRTITPKFPNFHFQFTDVFNQGYNAGGKVRASEFRFPYSDSSFDFAFATSVFTHLLKPDAENYLAEIARVLRTGGRCLVTLFILNDESRKLTREGAGSLAFLHDLGDAWTTDKSLPENAVAYDEGVVRSLYAGVGMSIENPIHGGSWCGRSPALSYQDIIVASKSAL
jgi:SAM-dependent methyltransferase